MLQRLLGQIGILVTGDYPVRLEALAALEEIIGLIVDPRL